jgi:hypothetical protein
MQFGLSINFMPKFGDHLLPGLPQAFEILNANHSFHFLVVLYDLGETGIQLDKTRHGPSIL